MSEKKSKLFESIQKSIDSVDKGFASKEQIEQNTKVIENEIYNTVLNKKIVKTISIDQKTQNMLNELKENNNKVDLSQLVRREVFKIYKELIYIYWKWNIIIKNIIGIISLFYKVKNLKKWNEILREKHISVSITT